MQNYNVILIGIDTLRADHLGCYGYQRPTSPTIDALAKESVLFENCFAQAPVTAPSFMSIFTSRYPTYHGITSVFGGAGRDGRMYALDHSVPTLAQILSKNNYRTGAFTDGGNLYGELGFNKGFGHYAMNLHGNLRHEDSVLGRIPEDEILYWVRENARENFFLFFHTFAVHNPWVIPPHYLTIFNTGYRGDLLITSADFLKHMGIPAEKDSRSFFLKKIAAGNSVDVDYLVAIYDGAITYVDDFIKNMLVLLEDLKIDDRTIIIFTSDHGEEFLEHGMLSHRQLYNELLHIPLIIRAPHFKKAATVDQVVRGVDILPTILELLGISHGPPTHGTSLVPAFKTNLNLSAIAETENHGYAIQDTKYKYLYPFYKDPKTRMDELYDLEKDPFEQENIARQNPELVEEMLYRFTQELHHRVVLPHPQRKIIYLSKLIPY